MSSMPRPTAAQLKKLRARLSLTQEEAARLLGVSWITVNRWERGKSTPSPLAMERLKQLGSSSPTQRVGKRLSFQCTKCGSPTDAPVATKRAALKVCRVCMGKRKDLRPRSLNDLSGAEWARNSKSIESYPDTRSDKQRSHGAAFPKSLAKQQIEIFTRRGEFVLDPFLGVGTTLDAAHELGRTGMGIELNKKFAKLALNDLKRSGSHAQVIVDDARNILAHLAPNSVDFILTSPPYGALLKSVKGNFAYKWQEHSTLNPISNPLPYSDRPEDLGNMNYPEFLEAVEAVMRCCHIVLRPDCYSVWVVKDYRDLKRGVPYVNFHGHLCEIAQRSGFKLWDIRIIDQTKFRPLVCLGFPSRNFYLNIGHSYLVTLRKGV